MWICKYFLKTFRFRNKNGIWNRQMNWYGRTFDNTNTAICEFKLKLKNIGSVVIENWFVTWQNTNFLFCIDKNLKNSFGMIQQASLKMS